MWVNSLWPGDAIWQGRTWSTLIHVMVCRMFGAKPLPETVLNFVN